MPSNDPSAAWEANAADWIAWARTPAHDAAFWDVNLPGILDLIPPPGIAVVDIGCGEGRVGRTLAEGGYRVSGLDSSETLVEAARAAGGYDELVCGDATALPWPDGSFDLAIACMCLMDMPDPAGAVREAARVLAPGGRIFMAIGHPLGGDPAFLQDYFTPQRWDNVATIGELSMEFVGLHRPLSFYTGLLSEAGFAIEAFREPRPEDEAVAASPWLAAAQRQPWFIHILARLPE